MRELELSKESRAELLDIADYTIERFGVEQAKKYQSQLFARLNVICSGQPPYGRPCNQLAGPNSAETNLLYYREGMHYIIFELTEDRVVVHDFAHVSRNLPELLAGLESRDLT